jgi:hypothetical protein
LKALAKKEGTTMRAIILEGLESGGAEFVAEEGNLEARFRSNTNSPQASPKEWADAYLAAFSFTIGSRLVTFDRALAGKVKGTVLLS